MSRALASFTVKCPSCHASFPVDPEKVPDGGIYAICAQCDRTFFVTQPEGAGPEAGIAAGPEAGTEIEPGWGEGFDAAAGTAAEGTDLEQGEATRAEPAETEPVGTAGDFELVTDEPEEAPAPEAPAAEAEPEPGTPAEPEPTAPELPEAPAARAPEPESPTGFEDLRGLASEAVSEAGGGPAHTGGSTLSSGAQKFGRRDPEDRAKRLARVLVSDIIAYYPERFQESRARGTVKEDFESEVQKSWKEYVDQVGEELAESTPYFTEALNEILGGGEEIF